MREKVLAQGIFAIGFDAPHEGVCPNFHRKQVQKEQDLAEDTKIRLGVDQAYQATACYKRKGGARPSAFMEKAGGT